MNQVEIGEVRRYDPAEIERRWQQRWLVDGLYEVVIDDPLIAIDAVGPPAENAAIRSGGHERPFTGVDTPVADALRLAALRAEPTAGDVDVEDFQLKGCERFLHRVWRLAATDEATIDRIFNTVRTGHPMEVDRAVETATHVLINRVTDNYEGRAFNAAVAALMAFTNILYKYVQSDEGPHGSTLAFAVDTMLLLMAPAVPHITAELWAIRHDGEHIHTTPWPIADPDMLIVSSVTMVIQVNGRVRDRVEVPPGITAAGAEAIALRSQRVRELLNGRSPGEVVVPAPNLVNIVR